MSKRHRGATDLDGLLLVAKPAGLTSFDVVRTLKHLSGEGRIGHAGTLDPFADGLLICCIGPSARHINDLQRLPKTYLATITLGSATDTDDLTGQIVAAATPDPALADAQRAESALRSCVGVQMQTPPAYSAVKQDGRPAYQQARQGHPVALRPRQVEVYAAQFLGQDLAAGGQTIAWRVRFEVSKGTYIRALARDLGARLGCPAHLSALSRTGIGPYRIADAVSYEQLQTLQQLEQPARLDALRQLLIPYQVKQAQIVEWQPDLQNLGPAVAILGVFDGMHSGHRHIIADTIIAAQKRQVPAWVITFGRDPDEVFKPAQLTKLMSNHKRIQALSQSGVDGVLVLPVPEVLDLSAADFIHRILEGCFDLQELHMGVDLRFGARAAGTVSTLEEWSQSRGKTPKIVAQPLYLYDGKPITATRIRAAYAAGDNSLAAKLLYG